MADLTPDDHEQVDLATYRAERVAALIRARKAIADALGWQWCDEHQSPRWDGAAPCRNQHPPTPDPDTPAWCVTCERLHGPMDWGDGCMDIEEAKRA